MAKATDHPGLKWRGNRAYWMPPERDIAGGYPIKSLTLDPKLSEEQRNRQCRDLWRDLQEWRDGNDTGARKHSIRWLIVRYQTDEFSPYRQLRANSKASYDDFLRILDKDIGTTIIGYGLRKVPSISGEDFRRWHKRFGKPDATGNPTTPSRARHLIVMLRALFSYAVEIGVPAAKELRDVLSVMRFPSTPPRDVAPTRDQVKAIVNKAAEMGWYSIAACTLAQFVFMERRISVLSWTWEDISLDWRIVYFQNKRGQVRREFNLAAVQPLLQLLQRTPKEKRERLLIRNDKTGEAWNLDHYVKTFRKIANAAGCPDIWSMDMRAGGITEADLLDINSRWIQDGAGHAIPSTTERYRRQKQRNAENVVELREAKLGKSWGTWGKDV